MRSQNRKSTRLPIYFIAFDCLNYRGRDLLSRPLQERKSYLAEVAADFLKTLQPVFEFAPEVDLETAI